MPVSYQHNYPACWVGGEPSGYHGHKPAVYMPTDTTQLGYYYQRVPTWVPRPGMIPQPMQPAQWHILQSQATGQYCPEGAVYGTAIQATPAEATPAQEDTSPAPETAPVPPTPTDAVSSDLERSATNPNLQPVIR